MKKLLLNIGIFLAVLLTVFTVIISNSSCNKLEPCEINNTGDVTFHDNGPSWVWDGCYLEVDWYNGVSNSGTFYGTKSYYDKPAGRADVYMEWEDNIAYYWSNGYVTITQCNHVDAYCTWDSKKSAVISEFITENKGKVLKSDVVSIEEFRKTIKK